MNPMTLFVATLLLVGLAVGLTPPADAREVPEVPPVCGSFYNWCENLVRDTEEKARETLCEMEACLPA